jgi:hypothetical protein
MLRETSCWTMMTGWLGVSSMSRSTGTPSRACLLVPPSHDRTSAPHASLAAKSRPGPLSLCSGKHARDRVSTCSGKHLSYRPRSSDQPVRMTEECRGECGSAVGVKAAREVAQHARWRAQGRRRLSVPSPRSLAALSVPSPRTARPRAAAATRAAFRRAEGSRLRLPPAGAPAGRAPGRMKMAAAAASSRPAQTRLSACAEPSIGVPSLSSMLHQRARDRMLRLMQRFGSTEKTKSRAE